MAQIPSEAHTGQYVKNSQTIHICYNNNNNNNTMVLSSWPHPL